MALKDRILVVPPLIILIISFSGMAFGQTPASGTPEARVSALRELSGSIEGVAKEAPRIFKTKEGYLRFIMAPPSAHFAVDRVGTAEEVASAFLERWREHIDEWEKVGSDFGYHYLGSAITFSKIGRAFGEATLELMKAEK